jgi:hypothetical protein
MKIVNGSKILLLITLIFCFSAPIPLHAFYKKKVLIGQFNNPMDWSDDYQPGNKVVELLTQELIDKGRVQIITRKAIPMQNDHSANDKYNVDPAIYTYGEMNFPRIISVQGSNMGMEKSIHKMEDAIDIRPPWPVEMGKVAENASLTLIKGEIIKFIPDSNFKNSDLSGSLISTQRENAEVIAYVEIIQNKTGRVLYEKTFRASSIAGTQSFSETKLNPVNIQTPEPSSMNLALVHLIREMSTFITDKLDSIKLEGEIIAVKMDKMSSNKKPKGVSEEVILVNLGAVNGVRIGDIFNVYAMSLGLQDPFSGNDLGDIYERAGVIQIMNTGQGFSKAISIGGNNYKTGYLIESLSMHGKSKFGDFTKSKPEKIPWWDFHGIQSVN